jgi:integrase
LAENSEAGQGSLFSLLAGSGLRVGEALGLTIENISADFKTLHIRQSVWEGTTQKPKTASAIRDVDLCPALATMLKEFIDGRTAGFVFRNGKRNPLAQSNVLRRSLHPMLESIKVPKAGFHSFRRFRARTSLSRLCRNLGLNFGWGISESYQTEEYVKLLDEVEYRRQVADSIGLGFELLPEKPIVCNVRIKSAKEKIAIAA